MKLLTQVSLTSASLAASIAVSDRSTNTDPLIDKSGENIVFWGAVVFAIILVVVIGIVSPKIEHAIIAAIVASLILIGLFFLLAR